MKDEREAFEDAVKHFVGVASLVAVQIDDTDYGQEFKDDYRKRLNWLVHTSAEYESAKGTL